MNNHLDEQVVYGSFIGNCYILNIQGEIDEVYLKQLYAETFFIIEHNVDLKGTIFDFSNISTFDSNIFISLRNISKTISLMGIKVIWIGLKPGVVSTLVDLNVKSDDIRIAVNLQHSLSLINSKESDFLL
ncbi:MAG: rsbS [Firmicutes bacterium]|nr:rsbS [Bacillota bacterium]